MGTKGKTKSRTVQASAPGKNRDSKSVGAVGKAGISSKQVLKTGKEPSAWQKGKEGSSNVSGGVAGTARIFKNYHTAAHDIAYKAPVGSSAMEVDFGILYPNTPPEILMSPFQKMGLVDQGISKSALESLKEKARLGYEELALVLNVGRTKLINKKGNETFDHDLSDKIVGLAEIYSYGYSVFGGLDQFNKWVFEPNLALGGRAPFDLLNSSFGKEEVKNLIGRIEYGVYS